MQVIGILGGVGSGKSLVARQLAQLGAGVLDADGVGHEVLRLPAVEAAARARWGGGVFGADGRIDRPRLAKMVFAPGPEADEERKFLEQLTHPEIGRRLAEQSRRLAERGVAVAVLDAPLLLEAGWDRLCERLIFVDAPRQVRLARALSRGWTEEDFDAREAAQESLERKHERADVIIDNSRSAEHTQTQVQRVWQRLVN